MTVIADRARQLIALLISLSGTGSPVGVVTPITPGQQYTDTDTGHLWISMGLADTDWQDLNLGGAPTGAAGGDLSGTYPDPTVAEIGGVAIVATGGATGDLLTQQSDGSFAPAIPPINIGYVVAYLPTGTGGVDERATQFTANPGEIPGAATYDTGPSLTSLPFVVAPGGVVCAGFNASVGNLSPLASDACDLQGNLVIGNTAGTEVLAVQSPAVNIPTGTTSGSLGSWTGSSVTAIVGTDLSWDDSAGHVISAAGGVFVVLSSVNVVGD